jgi:hypothetical protein
MAFHHSPRIVSDGLIYAIDIANSKSYPGSGTTVNDLMSTDTLAVSNAVITTTNPAHISFDGSGDYATLSAAKDAGGEYTFTFWFRGDDFTSAAWGYFAKLTSASGYAGFAINEGASPVAGIDPGELYYYGGSNANALISSALSVNVWHNIAFSCKTSTKEVKTYINGALQTTTTVTDTLGSEFLKFGYPDTSHYLKGDMGNILIYNKQLSDAEILQNYNAMKGRFE